MRSHKTSLFRRMVKVAGVWLAPEAIEAVRDVPGVGVRVYLASGAELDISATSSTGTAAYNLTAAKFIDQMREPL